VRRRKGIIKAQICITGDEHSTTFFCTLHIIDLWNQRRSSPFIQLELTSEYHRNQEDIDTSSSRWLFTPFQNIISETKYDQHEWMSSTERASDSSVLQNWCWSSCAGKTAFVHRLCEKTFHEATKATIGVADQGCDG
jgi:hypothetical protein